MVNIEVGRARMYFSVENRIKMGLVGLDMENTIFGAKRRRFIHENFFFNSKH